MHDFRKSLLNSTLHKVLQRLHYSLEGMLTCGRWYLAYPLSLRHVCCDCLRFDSCYVAAPVLFCCHRHARFSP